MTLYWKSNAIDKDLFISIRLSCNRLMERQTETRNLKEEKKVFFTDQV